MAILKLDTNKIKPMVFATTGLFLIFALVYFLPIEIPHKITLGVATLSVASLWLCPWPISLALLFSAIGDYAGSCNNFLLQMGSFAVNHVFLLGFLIWRWRTKVERDGKMTTKVKGFAFISLLLVLAIIIIAMVKIVPCTPVGVIRTGVIIYIILISSMLYIALLQRSSLYALGAVLFVFSDFVLAWNKFVEPILYQKYLIMVTYYLAQWLIFVRSTPYRIGNQARRMRF